MALIVIGAYIIRTIRTILYNLYWWDKKEYRFDRMIVHLRETKQGRRWMFGPMSAFKWMLLFLFFLNIPFLSFFVYIIYLIEATKIVIRLKKDKRPPNILRPKPLLITIGSLFVIWLLVLLITFDYPLGLALLIGDKALPFIIAFGVMFVSVPFNFYKKEKMARAQEKMSKARGLKVVGVTGSYGKTTTKDLTAQILSKKYRVLKTQGSQNTDIGIAELILKSNLSEYDIFVCEIAAYKKGEIAECAKMLGSRVETGIITGINEQHQSLFKSIDTTMHAKYEMIDATCTNGTAIFNGENTLSKEMATWAKRRKLKVKIVRERLAEKYRTRFPGEYFKQNLALSIEAAKSVGMKPAEIKKAVRGLKLPKKTMAESKQENITYINDTFNSNPDAVFAGLSYIAKKHGSKILVLQPLIELGWYADEAHEEMGKKAAEVCDSIILTNANWMDSFVKGASTVDGGAAKVQLAGSLPKVEKGVILFEGKEAENYLPKGISTK